ncbi:nitroreductase [Aliikangiella marina]|uniref:Nitroreductase n=1 Tax=Aliikangiella marina TaxID=1712262 RepID=A0A545TII8_9GAMM|nr:nitroreductase family protein [Aliikangiella marina]TQV77028.1 nitroreductase [Aliikangiella marina]
MKTLLKKIVPESLFLVLVKLRDDVNYFKLVVAKSNKITAYFSLLWSRLYLNEHFAFLRGAYDYESRLRHGKRNLYFIRRNVHRIEKGLTMIPRRQVFALRFILETVEAFKFLSDDSGRIKTSEYNWAKTVLDEYFDVTDSDHEQYLKAQSLYRSLSTSFDSKVEGPVEYKNEIEIDKYLSLKLLCENRKSVRWFKTKKVSKNLINKALEVALLSPSSCNRQPFKFYIISDPELAREVAKVPAGTVGWSENVQCIAVLVGDLKAFSNIANRHSIYVDGTLAVMPFVLALEAQGLSSCIINWADNHDREKKMCQLIGLSDSEKVVLSIAIGHAVDEVLVPYSKRKSIKEISEFIE